MAESARHKKLKKHISSFFSDRGWNAQEEAKGPGWRADCLIEKNGRRAALEIELSQPSMAKIKERSEVYKRAGIPSVWLVPKRERFYTGGYSPIFAIEEKNGQEIVHIEGEQVTLDSFLAALDEERLRYRRTVLDQKKLGALVCFQADCYHCDKSMSVWQGVLLGLCLCGQMHIWPDEMPDALFEQEMRKIWDPFHSPFGPTAFYKRRGSSVRPAPYYAAHCPSCNRLQGNFYLQQEASFQLQGLLRGQGGYSCQVRYLGSDVIGPEHLRAFEEELYLHWCLEQKK